MSNEKTQEEQELIAAARVAQLNKMRVPFESHQINKLPKPTKKQTDLVKDNYTNGIRCDLCGTWHHKDVVHLDYVGHAALTDRLLEVDPFWTWEPFSIVPDGLPKFDAAGGMWIRLTICGVTRIGYGDAQGKTGPNAIKEIIGDALRNGGMRFGAALDLWHKGILQMDVAEEDVSQEKKELQILSGVAYKRALAAVKAGEYKVSDIRLTYILTVDQETELKDSEKDVAK